MNIFLRVASFTLEMKFLISDNIHFNIDLGTENYSFEEMFNFLANKKVSIVYRRI